MRGTQSIRTAARRGARTLALAGLGAAALGAASPAVASAATLTNAYSCPTLSPTVKDATVRVSAPLPSTLATGASTVELPVSITIGFPDLVWGRANASGQITVGATITSVTGKQSIVLSGQYSSVVAAQGTTTPFTDHRDLTTTATLSPLSFPTSGPASISITSVSYSANFSDSLDGLPIGPSGGGNCTVAPDQNDVLATIDVVDGPLPPFPPPTVKDITATSATICAPNLIRPAILYRWVVFDGSTKLGASARACQSISGLSPNTAYTLTVKIGLLVPGEDLGSESGLTSEGDVSFKTLPAAVPALPDYALTGAATLKTLTTGTIPLKGGLSAVTYDASTGGFSGNLAIEKANAKLVVLGFLPLTADIAIVPTEKLSGTLKDGRLVVTTKVRIKLLNVRSGNIVFVGGVGTCQTKQVSSITLRSTQAGFQPLIGGPLAGTFSISNLAGCGPLTGLLSTLTAGSGNAIVVNATPKV